MADCLMCKPPRLAQEVFAQLHRFPDPVKKHNSESYEDFHDVWSKDTTEKDRPSFVTKKSADVNQPSFRKSSETLRDLVICGECLKVRCVYSAKALTKEQFLQFKKCKEDYIEQRLFHRRTISVKFCILNIGSTVIKKFHLIITLQGKNSLLFATFVVSSRTWFPFQKN